MEANAFIKEVYHRMHRRNPVDSRQTAWSSVENNRKVLETAHHYKDILPQDKETPILDIGFGTGWFIAACIRLGYRNIYGAEFGNDRWDYMKEWSPHIKEFYEIETNIGDFLGQHEQSFAFIHLSHVIEHIPKYSLLYLVDSLFFALKKNGTLMVRCPNMEGPCPLSVHYVTLGHEYGFSRANLRSLLDMCGFDSIKLHQFPTFNPTLRNRITHLPRHVIIMINRIKHHFFGSADPCGDKPFGIELIATAKRFDHEALYDKKFQ